MKEHVKEEVIIFLSITFALVATASLVYLMREPSITTNALLDTTIASSAIIVFLILSILTLVIGGIIAIHDLTKEVSSHQKAIHSKPKLSDENLAIITYVLRAKKGGYSDPEIIDRLEKDDWEPEEIKKYL